MITLKTEARNQCEDGLTRNLMRLVTQNFNVKKGQDFRTAPRREHTLGACINVHYWKFSPQVWTYCPGPNTGGNFDSIDYKVYVRDWVCDQISDATFVKELISL